MFEILICALPLFLSHSHTHTHTKRTELHQLGAEATSSLISAILEIMVSVHEFFCQLESMGRFVVGQFEHGVV